MPDEWQARQATPAILQVSSSKHNAKKISTRVRGPFHQSITAKCACVCVCVCVTMKKGVPDEWQARQATQAILQVSSSKHNAKKITTRVRGPFHQSITAILTEEKREEKQFTKPTHVAVYLFVCARARTGACTAWCSEIGSLTSLDVHGV